MVDQEPGSSRSPDVMVVWEGDTHDAICSFPKGARQNLGADLRRVQVGLPPLDGKPAPGVGPGVYELRDEDERAWYRLLYLKKIHNRIHVLHCFEKRSNKMEQKDIETAKQRLKVVQARLRQEARNAKRTRTGAHHEGRRSR